jgi:hypothetical protein
MAAKLTRLTHKIAIQLNLVAESCTICSSRSRRPVRKLLDTPSYKCKVHIIIVIISLPRLRPNGLLITCYRLVPASDVSFQRSSSLWFVHNVDLGMEVCTRAS